MFNFSIEIESLDNFKEPALFLNFLTEREIKEKKNPTFLIGKIAAKKAFFKIIDFQKNDFKKIEIRNLKSGRPFIEIKDKELKKILKNKKISLSISHTKDIAVAVCIIYDKKIYRDG